MGGLGRRMVTPIEDEILAALGEGRLLPKEEAELVRRLQTDGPSRAALRDLFPQTYARLFPKKKDHLRLVQSR